MSIKRVLLVIVAAFLITGLLAGCGGTAAPSQPAAIPVQPTAVPPTEQPQTRTGAAPAEPTASAPPAQSSWQVIDAGRIQFEPNAISWHTQGDLPSGSALRFVLNAWRGQQMNIRLNFRYGQPMDTSASLYVAGSDGTVLDPINPTYFSQVLPNDQDYFIEIRSLTPETTAYSISIQIPAARIDPALGDKYEPVDPSVCQIIQDSAAQGLGLEFYKDDPAPFMDTIAGEAGQGCHLYAVTDGTKISSFWDALQTLMTTAGAGWSEQYGYQAAGPTGMATAMVRDMGLMKMEVGWQPAMGVTCPEDQPITGCPMTPEQKIYSVTIDVAQYRSNISADGHWEDASQNFSLDLYQDWKNVYGKHTVVAQGGAKIDTMDVSITGLLQGDVVNLQFKNAFTRSEGRAQISFIDINTIHWKIITPPDGEYYLPAEATLVRK